MAQLTKESFFWNFKRVALDICVLVAILIVGAVFAEGLVELFLAKLMLISAGIVHAHITRKIVWPYISFSEDTDNMRRLMIISWYTVIIWGWARGG